MARYYGEIRGRAATKATCEGDEHAGISAHIRGWDVGVKVECSPRHDNVAGRSLDECHIFLTGGSNNPRPIKEIALAYEAGTKGDSPSAFSGRRRL